MAKRYFLVIFVLFLCGCVTMTTWSRVSGEYRDGARRFKAILPVGWMRYNQAEYFITTRDGIVLESIAVQRLRIKDKLEHTKKKFFKGMTVYDLAEIEIDNFKSNDKINRYEVIENKPLSIAGEEAFRIKYSYYSKGGLKVSGIHYGFIHKDAKEKEVIYRVEYEAASQHYFKKYLSDFEKFIESFKLI